jgi:hypothetical protein
VTGIDQSPVLGMKSFCDKMITMSLLDHFHPPLNTLYPWHSIHHAWCTTLAIDLNRHLPEQCYALPSVQFGIEIDVATFDQTLGGHTVRETATVPYLAHAVDEAPGPNGAGTSWMPPPPALTIEFEVTPETVEVLIYDPWTNPTLVGAIELVSPANKDRATQRTAFVAKCETYLRQGVGLVIVDIVTSRRANLHDELLTHLGAASASSNANLYASAYRPLERASQPNLDIWHEELALGHVLPTLPLWLRGELYMPVALQATYERTCRELRLTAPGPPIPETEAQPEKNR